MRAMSSPEALGWSMDIARKAAYLSLCAAMDKGAVAACSENGPAWDAMTEMQQVMTCKTCPLKRLCKAYGETDPENTWGVWGGVRYPRTASGKRSEANPDR